MNQKKNEEQIQAVNQDIREADLEQVSGGWFWNANDNTGNAAQQNTIQFDEAPSWTKM